MTEKYANDSAEEIETPTKKERERGRDRKSQAHLHVKSFLPLPVTQLNRIEY